MSEHATPLAPDQPTTHVYEPPHNIDIIPDDDDRPTHIDGDWYTQPGKGCFDRPWVWATVNVERRTFDISAIKTVGMDAGEARQIASYLADAVRWATGEIEKLNNTPGPKEGANEQDARGGFDRKDGE